MILSRKEILLSLVFCFSSVALSAPTIRSINIEGNTVHTSREILAWLTSKQSALYSESFVTNDVALVHDNYRRRGYLAVDVRPSVRFSDDSIYVDMNLTVREGRQTIIGAMTFRGNYQIPSEEILTVFDMKPGDPLDEPILEKDLDGVLARYERLGYPFAQCNIERLTHRAGNDNDTLDIVLAVNEGQRVTIDEIKVEGNKETEPSVIVRETRIGAGEMFNPAKVEAIKPRLKRLNIFADVSDAELYERNAKTGLLIKVQEGSTNTFDGVVGYVPGSNADQSGYLTGLVSISMRNLFGTGRKLSFRWASARIDRHKSLEYDTLNRGYSINLQTSGADFYNVNRILRTSGAF